MLFHSKVYELAINLVKDSIHALISEEENRKNNTNNLNFNVNCLKMRELFKACFFFLKNFVKNNP
jgi:hypothetical protein